MINVTLKGGVVREYEEGSSIIDVAKSLGAGLFKAACLARVNGEVCDLRTKLENDCEVEILTFDDAEAMERYKVHPAHVAVAAYFKGITEGRAEADYEA